MPGREAEYENLMRNGGAQVMGTPAPRLPIDDERRSRSPGLQNNFYDKSNHDFRRPYGTGSGGGDDVMVGYGSMGMEAPPPDQSFGAQSPTHGRGAG